MRLVFGEAVLGFKLYQIVMSLILAIVFFLVHGMDMIITLQILTVHMVFK